MADVDPAPVEMDGECFPLVASRLGAYSQAAHLLHAHHIPQLLYALYNQKGYQNLLAEIHIDLQKRKC